MAGSVPLTMESAPLEPKLLSCFSFFPGSALSSQSLLLAQYHLLQEASQTTLPRSVYIPLKVCASAHPISGSYSQLLFSSSDTVFACLAFLQEKVMKRQAGAERWRRVV